MSVPLPNSPEAEREVLGAILLRTVPPGEFVASGLSPGDFYRIDHQAVCSAMLSLISEGVEVDPVSLREQMVLDKTWDSAGRARVLSNLMDTSSLPSSFAYMCEKVRSYALSREMVQHGWNVSRMAMESPEATAVFESANKSLRDIAKRGKLSVGVSVQDGLRDYVDYVKRVMEGEITDTRIPTGLRTLDDRLGGGVRTGWQIVVLSSAGHGKTAFAVNNLALSAAKAGHPVLICSLEMQPSEVVGRMVAAESGVPVHVHDRPGLESYDFSKIMGAADRINALPIRIIGAKHGTLEGIVSVARQMHAENGRLGMVVVDYLQLMKSPSADMANGDERAISANSGGLKLMANELDCVSVLLSQPVLSAKRDMKRPTIQQAKGSGSIEDDADLALVPWLPGNVDEDARRPDALLGQPAEMGMEKFRHGPRRNLGEDVIKWNPQRMRFEEV
tara:strand:- start:12235 stop:13575 length:1341 start_codon:yes stop_codon:yes gene_type:complete